jgi:CubicO group peptidase (beta-lactamase class C family)
MAHRSVVVLSCALVWTAAAAWAQPATTSLDKDLAPFLEAYKLPALAAAVVKDGKTVAAGAVGTRRAGTDSPVTLQDRFHIGSDTKAMTALLAAILIDEGKLSWNSTVGEIYPDLVATMSAGVKDITLEQLLSHTSGIPGDKEEHIPLISFALTDEPANLDGMRAVLVSRLVTQTLSVPPGQRFEYSNLGYTLAGAMMEKVTGRTWEELLVARVFEPLKLTSAGFGPQSTMGRVDAPLGHALDKDGKLQAFLAGPWGDNPPIIGPAGTVHMSVLDFATWAAWNASEGRVGPPLVKPETVRKMHTKVVDMPTTPDAPVGTPSTGGYGLGWGTTPLPFASETFVFHGGSNNMNLAYILLLPERQFGMVLLTNVGGKGANEGLMSVAEMLYNRYGTTR